MGCNKMGFKRRFCKCCCSCVQALQEENSCKCSSTLARKFSPKRKFLAGYPCGHPAKNFGQALQILENKHFGTDILRGRPQKNFGLKKLRADFSFPNSTLAAQNNSLSKYSCNCNSCFCVMRKRSTCQNKFLSAICYAIVVAASQETILKTFFVLSPFVHDGA